MAGTILRDTGQPCLNPGFKVSWFQRIGSISNEFLPETARVITLPQPTLKHWNFETFTE
jgi:hypothetical protein